MAKPTLRQTIDNLLTEYEPVIREAFLASIADIRSQITLKAVVEALQRQDVNAALDALNLDRAAFSRVENAIALAYNAGGTAMTGNMPTLRDATGNRILVRFDTRNVRAENWLREHSANLVTRVIEEQRATIRGALETALQAGQNPNKTALDIVGRLNRVTAKREGGFIGLTGPQSEYVASARSELLSGDPTALRSYLGRGRRDKRFDRTVMKALQDGKALDQATVNKIVGRYTDGLLQLRGEMLARTETLTSIHAAKREGFVQGLEKTNYPPEAVSRVWRSAGDGRVRHTHSAMNGQIVNGLDTPFQSPSGALLRFPGDKGLGAGAAEVINCRCDVDMRIDFSWGVS